MSEDPNEKRQERQKPDLPEETLRIMERMVKTPPDPKKPKPNPKREKPAK
ncbi:MAG: hypothetical protein WDZ83_05320 [Rhizobiaceae bacterium]